MQLKTWLSQGIQGYLVGPIVFIVLFFSYYTSPRSILSLLGIKSPVPAQLAVLAITIVLVVIFALSRNLIPKLTAKPTPIFIATLAGSIGVIFTFARSLDATLWSRPTLDLASMLLLVPVAYLSGFVSRRIGLPMLWVLLSFFFVQLLWAVITGPNHRGAFTFHSVHTIEFGLMMGTATLVSLALFLAHQRWFFLFFPIIFGTGVLISLSRGALVATICGLVIMLLLEMRRTQRYRSVLFFVGLVPLGTWASSSLLYTLDPRIRALAFVREHDILEQFLRTSDSDRWRLWHMVLDKAPAGWGVLWGSGDSYVDFGREELSHPHNLFLIYGVTGGLIALLLIGIFLLIAFYSSVFASRQDPASNLLAGLLALWAIHLQFNGGIGDGANLFLLAGFALGRIAALSSQPAANSVLGLKMQGRKIRKTSER